MGKQEARSGAGARQHDRLGDELTDNAAAACAQREPYGDFTAALRDRERQYAVQADRGERESQCADGGREQRGGLEREHLVEQHRRERLEAERRAEQGLPEDAPPVIADKEQRSFADPDARIMLMKRGEYDYAYNAQAAVDGESGVIVAAALTNVAPDVGHLPAMAGQVRALREAAEVPDHDPTTLSADAGYFSGENASEDGAGLDLLIAAGRDDPATSASPSDIWSAEAFGYDPVRDVWVCPADKLLVRQVTPPGATGRPSKHRYLAPPEDCAACPLRARCLKPGEERRLLVSQRSRPTGAMRFKLRQPDARRRYARRKAIVEPVFGQLKDARGFTTLGLRGLARAAGEYLLACLAHNLGKLLRVCPLPGARPAVVAA
jgi:hypothetical protein